MDQALARLQAEPDLRDAPRSLLREGAQVYLDGLREAIRTAKVTDAAQLATNRLWPDLLDFVREFARPRFRRVLNATGVVAHTNLGRSLLAESAARAAYEACRHYSNLEFDLATGKRGSRYSHVERLLCSLTGAEAALVVNNNAAAVLLVLESLAKGREVVVSRGQLVEIGGSFRIPDVMARSGAILREVGATNRTHLYDYEQAIGPETAALLKVHTSNFRVVGFTNEVPLPELSGLAKAHGLPLIEDLGSGSLEDLSQAGLPGEPTVRRVVESGADVVTFSGDKVLGGPQAGIIVGRADLVAAVKKNPLNRALRIDKMTLAALEATLRLYLEPERARREAPTLAMILASPEDLASKAKTLARAVKRAAGEHFAVACRPGFSQVGGGAFPERGVTTTLVRVTPKNPGLTPDRLRARLLRTDPPLVGRVEDGAFLLDPRTLEKTEFPLVGGALACAALADKHIQEDA